MNEPATVTIVIPTRNSERTLEACLKSVKSQSYPCVIVVVDNQSNDRTLEIANSLADIVLAVEPERSAQRNAGAHATAADILGFIDSDMILSSRVVAEAVEAIQSGAASVVVPERSIGQGYWAGVRAFEREFYRGSDSIEAPRFFLRSVFDKVGGWDEELTGPEDWDLRIRVKQVGVMARIKSEIDHDEGYVRYLDADRK
ncbi:MAG: glycosyltransferase, partial [Actinomycetota bacterium]